MPVEVQVASSAPGLPAAGEIEKWACTALEEAADDGEPPDLCIRLVDAEESRSLNDRYRGQDKPTNVLSFPADVDVPGTTLLGDLVICVPVVIDEAHTQSKQTADHFAHMVVHGVLHLLGHDHTEAASAVQMEALEVKVLHRLGVSDPYEQ